MAGFSGVFPRLPLVDRGRGAQLKAGMELVVGYEGGDGGHVGIGTECGGAIV